MNAIAHDQRSELKLFECQYNKLPIINVNYLAHYLRAKLFNVQIQQNTIQWNTTHLLLDLHHANAGIVTDK